MPFSLLRLWRGVRRIFSRRRYRKQLSETTTLSNSDELSVKSESEGIVNPTNSLFSVDENNSLDGMEGSPTDVQIANLLDGIRNIVTGTHVYSNPGFFVESCDSLTGSDIVAGMNETAIEKSESAPESLGNDTPTQKAMEENKTEGASVDDEVVEYDIPAGPWAEGVVSKENQFM